MRFVATDFADLSRHAAALAADDVFCCLGTTIRAAGSQPAFERVDYHMVVDLARAAHKAGAKRFFVVSAVGASEHSAAFYSRVKGRMEAAVRQVPSGFTMSQPGLLLPVRPTRSMEASCSRQTRRLLLPRPTPMRRRWMPTQPSRSPTTAFNMMGHLTLR